MEVMPQVFQKFLTPEQKKLADLVEKKGGNGVLDDEHVMKELSAAEASLAPASGRHGSGRFDLAEIQHEIRDDPTDAIEKNAEFFHRKFDVQRRQIEEDIAHTVRREGDRIITAVTAGPHDRIVDPVRPTPTLTITYKSMFNVCLGSLPNLERHGEGMHPSLLFRNTPMLNFTRDGGGTLKRGISLWP